MFKFELYVYEIYADDAPEDEEEMDTVDRKRLKIRSESAQDEPRKSKKKARVLVEVSDQRSPLFF
jgi:protein MAK16